MVNIGDYSTELCGGTHVRPDPARSAWSSCSPRPRSAPACGASRRWSARTRFRFLAREHVLVSQLAEQFKAKPEELPERIEQTVTRLRTAEKELERLRAGQLLSRRGSLADKARGRARRRAGRRGRPGRRRAATTCASSPPTCAAGSARGPAWWRCSRRPTASSASSSRRRRRPGTRASPRASSCPSFADGDRRPWRRQARHGPGRWHEPGRCAAGRSPRCGRRCSAVALVSRGRRPGSARMQTIRAAAGGWEWMSDRSGSGWR